MKQKKRRSEFKQGTYRPRYPDKCFNRICTYRSSWELKFFEWCDRSPNIVKWGSESQIINYQHPVKKTNARYYPDGVVWMVDQKTQKVVKYIVEIKPYAQTQPPVPSKRKKPKTVLYESLQWEINQSKWEAARQWCKLKGYQFIILTEHHLNPS